MNGKRLMIVEDEQHIQLTLKLYLQSRGFEVQVADNGCRALDLLYGSNADERGYDLILTDIRMPEMTGVELLEKMRELGVFIPAVVMTGYGDEDSFVRLEKVGCFRIVQKPFTTSKIESVIVDALASKSSGDGRICAD
jgi:DNA-binding NtrC family response regulator